MKLAYILVSLLTAIASISAESLINKNGTALKLSAEAELGFISILNHTLQNGDDSTNFNYIEQGGQDILFPYSRYQLGLKYKKNMFNFLYQPLEVITNVTFREDVKIDDTTFSSGTPMELTYSFPYWRLTYLYDFINSPNTVL